MALHQVSLQGNHGVGMVLPAQDTRVYYLSPGSSPLKKNVMKKHMVPMQYLNNKYFLLL